MHTKNIIQTTFLSITLMLSACSGTTTALQRISDARTAANAAAIQCPCSEPEKVQKKAQCNCQTLKNTHKSIAHAEELLKYGYTEAALNEAQTALDSAQQFLRRQHTDKHCPNETQPILQNSAPQQASCQTNHDSK